MRGACVGVNAAQATRLEAIAFSLVSQAGQGVVMKVQVTSE
jgi:hypothetical protein